MKKLLGCLAFVFFFACMIIFTHNHAAKTIAKASTASTPNEALPPANPVQAAKCRKLLKDAPVTWKMSEAQAGYGTVVVGPTFYGASFENKQWFDATVRCVLSEGRDHYAGIKYVTYLDSYTNKEIAKWSDVTGFSVD
jgi:hypothetical protein